MKKLFTCLMLMTVISAIAQIPNASFKTWTAKSNPLQLPVIGNVNVNYRDPDSWTSLNQVTNVQVPLFGINGKQGVTEDTIVKKDSSSSAKLTNFTLNTPNGNVKIPGMMFNGTASLDLSSLSGDPNALLLAPGSGQAISSRPKAVQGFYKFKPVNSDTFEMVAILRKGDEIVAQAQFTGSALDTATWKNFYLKFTYESCTMPDTMFILFSSHVLETTGISGNDGSTLWVDSVSIDSLNGYNPPLPPNARDDYESLQCLQSKVIDFKSNDRTCGLPVKYAFLGQYAPSAGTVAITGTATNPTLTYSLKYSKDSFDIIEYSICDTVSKLCDTAYINIDIIPINNKLLVDTISVPKNNKVNIYVKTNDTITTCYVPTITINKNPSKGTAVVKTNTYIEYTANTNALGKDTFMYKICGTAGTTTVCDSAFAYVTIMGTSDVKAVDKNLLMVYPNPASTYIDVQQTQAGGSIALYNMAGMMIKQIHSATAMERLDLEEVPAGLYTLHVTDIEQNKVSYLIQIVK